MERKDAATIFRGFKGQGLTYFAEYKTLEINLLERLFS